MKFDEKFLFDFPNDFPVGSIQMSFKIPFSAPSIITYFKSFALINLYFVLPRHSYRRTFGGFFRCSFNLPFASSWEQLTDVVYGLGPKWPQCPKEGLSKRKLGNILFRLIPPICLELHTTVFNQIIFPYMLFSTSAPRFIISSHKTSSMIFFLKFLKKLFLRFL